MNLTLEQKIEVLKLVEPYKEKLSITFFKDNDITVHFTSEKTLCLSDFFGNSETCEITFVDDLEKFKEILKERMEAENGIRY